MCQCPKRAFLISTWVYDSDIDVIMVCQCPKRAFLISTLAGWSRRDRRAAECQCPKRAFLISTGCPSVEIGRLFGCQCPKRAFLISTVPSGNPCKHWLPSLIFAGICQTILKTAVFLQFFGLFIICSYFFVLISSFHTPHYTSIISN